MVEALLQDLELGDGKGSHLPRETVGVLGILHRAQGRGLINRFLDVLVTGQGT